MKRILFVFIFSIICMSTVCAQHSRFGISVGVEMSKYGVYYDFDENPDIRPKVGFRVALEMDFCLVGNLYLVPELVFTQRGSSSTIKEPNYNDDGTYYMEKTNYTENLNCFQLPANAMYKIEIDDDALFCIFAGPYVIWHLNGKNKNQNDRNLDEKFKFGYKRGEYKPIDLGFNFGVGMEYMDFFVRAQYNHGLTNLLNGENVNYHRNRNVGLSIGFLF